LRNYRITLEDALQAHDESLLIGGRAGIASLHLLESAIARPYSGYHRSISNKAAALLQSVASNRSFIDGNKRTAWLLVALLIERSGYDLVTKSDDRIDDFVVDIVNRTLSFDKIVEWFADRISRP
jgi:death-on-curing protein